MRGWAAWNLVIQSVVVVKLRNRSEVVYPFISLLEFVAPPFLATLYADRARISSVSAIAAASAMLVNKRQNVGDSYSTSIRYGPYDVQSDFSQESFNFWGRHLVTNINPRLYALSHSETEQPYSSQTSPILLSIYETDQQEPPQRFQIASVKNESV